MVGNKGREQKKHIPLNAECVNIMARFIQIAKSSEKQTLYLRDRYILQKMSLIANKTTDQRLVDLHNQLHMELRKQNSPKKKPRSAVGLDSLSTSSNQTIKNLVDWAKSL